MGLTAPCACSETNTWACQTLLPFFFTSNSHIYRGFPASCTYIRPAALRTQPIGRAQAHVWKFSTIRFRLIAVQCAGPSWQPLWGSPTLPWPTCTLTEGSGAGLCTMLRLAALPTHTPTPTPQTMQENQAMEQRRGPAAWPPHMWNVQISPHTVTQQPKGEGGGGGERGP